MTAHRIYTLCFFLSGAAGLVYQIAWVRMFSLVFGNTVYAVALVVAGFMAGLALGAHFLGKWADSVKNPLKAYISLEVGIALAAIATSALVGLVDDAIVGVMDVDAIDSGQWQLLRFFILFLILVVPTSLMGGTLPMMSKFYVRGFDRVGLGVGSLYAANTYGAVIGCFLCGYLLIRTLGVWGALNTAFFLNLLVAALAWSAPAQAEETVAVRSNPKSAPKRKKKKDRGKGGERQTVEEGFAAHLAPVGLALGFSALAGFTALAFEILWTRAFVVSFKSTVYLFSNLLAVYLFFLALGSHVFSKWLDRLKDPLRLFGLAQVGIAVWGFLGVVIFYKTPDLAMSVGGMLGEMSLTKDVIVMIVLMVLAFALPVFLMGVSFPLITRVTARSLESIGRFSGLVYAVGTIGGIAGSLAAGFFLLPVLGLQTSVFVVSGVALATGFAALLSAGSRKGIGWVFPVSATAAIGIIGSVGISGINIGYGAAIAGDRVVFAEEGVMGSVRVTQDGPRGPLNLLVNNYQLATSGDVAVRFGHVPLILKPDAKDVLLISLGSGITAGSISGHPVDRIDCVEIVPTLIDVQPLFERDNHNVIADKRLRLTFWDGRHYVRATDRKYDMIISDLFQPDSAGVGNLYALEHFENAREKLKDGGMMAQWLPMYQLSPDNLKVVMRTFATAFKYVMVWSGDINSELPTLMLVGSQKPLKLDPVRLVEALGRDDVKKDIIENADPLSFLSFYVMDKEGVMEYTEGHPINTDNRPVIEYTAPASIWKRRENSVINFASIMENRKKFDLTGAGDDEHARKLREAVDRYFEGRTHILKGKIEHARRNFPAELEHYKKAVRLVPGEPFLALAAFDLGYVYYQRGDFRTAAQVFEWVKGINRNLLESHFYLAKSYQRLGDKEKALAAFKELAQINPELAKSLVAQ